jgi:Flp pilus assembly protein CpaB
VRRGWSRPHLYLGAAVALALTAGLVVNGYLSRMRTASPTSAGPQVAVVLASAPIMRGATIREDQLRLEPMPEKFVPPGSFDQVSEAAGRVALADLAKGEAVTETRLARVRAGPVASLIPPGLRAFAVPTSLPPGALVPGDSVDILATYGTGGGGQPHTEVVVSSVEVLFVLGQGAASGGGSTGDFALDAEGAGAGSSTTLILLVSEDQEGRLAYARAFADLAVAIAPAG